MNRVFAGESEMAERMRSMDWSALGLGPAAEWPEALRALLPVLLASRSAMWMSWGSEGRVFYNDASAAALRQKHPSALGRRAVDVWAEIWPVIGPRIESVLRGEGATLDPDLLLFVERGGCPEETYQTFSCSPVGAADGSPEGTLCIVVDETARVIGARRLEVLARLGAALAGARATDEVFAALEESLGGDAGDALFSLAYQTEDDGSLRLAARTGLDACHPTCRPRVSRAELDDTWSTGGLLVDDPALHTLGLDHVWPRRSLPRCSTQASVRALDAADGGALPSFLVVGLNPHRPFEAAYREFLRLFAAQIGAALGRVRATEGERRHRDADRRSAEGAEARRPADGADPHAPRAALERALRFAARVEAMIRDHDRALERARAILGRTAGGSAPWRPPEDDRGTAQ